MGNRRAPANPQWARQGAPSEHARESGLARRDVVVKCVELGVPIFNGRIDKTLFLSCLGEIAGNLEQTRHNPQTFGNRLSQPRLLMLTK